MEYISESTTMSKSMEDYGDRKSCAITTAKRLSLFLGESPRVGWRRDVQEMSHLKHDRALQSTSCKRVMCWLLLCPPYSCCILAGM